MLIHGVHKIPISAGVGNGAARRRTDMERLTDKKEADAQRREYEIRLKQGYPRNIPEERFLRLAAYEDTGLEPGEIEQLKGEVLGLRLDKQELEQYRALGPIDRLRELAQADKDGKIKAYIVDSFYCDICQKRHDRIKEIKVYLTRDAAEAALSERR